MSAAEFLRHLRHLLDRSEHGAEAFPHVAEDARSELQRAVPALLNVVEAAVGARRFLEASMQVRQQIDRVGAVYIGSTPDGERLRQEYAVLHDEETAAWEESKASVESLGPAIDALAAAIAREQSR